jgi:hypothetical protein
MVKFIPATILSALLLLAPAGAEPVAGTGAGLPRYSTEADAMKKKFSEMEMPKEAKAAMGNTAEALKKAMPVPGTFVIGQDGIVKAAFADTDYTQRMDRLTSWRP